MCYKVFNGVCLVNKYNLFDSILTHFYYRHVYGLSTGLDINKNVHSSVRGADKNLHCSVGGVDENLHACRNMYSYTTSYVNIT